MKFEKARGFFNIPDNGGCVVLQEPCNIPNILWNRRPSASSIALLPHNDDCETDLEPNGMCKSWYFHLWFTTYSHNLAKMVCDLWQARWRIPHCR